MWLAACAPDCVASMAESDVRITAPWLWDVILAFAGEREVCDVCTEEDNPLRAPRFFTARTNGLASPWATTVQHVYRWTHYGNVPYSAGQVAQWQDKFTREGRLGLECLMLTQCDVSTGWYASIRENADARCHLGRRVTFLEPDGAGGYRPCKGGAKFGSQVAYWGPRRRRFARVFGAVGEVIHGLGPCELEGE